MLGRLKRMLNRQQLQAESDRDLKRKAVNSLFDLQQRNWVAGKRLEIIERRFGIKRKP